MNLSTLAARLQGRAEWLAASGEAAAANDLRTAAALIVQFEDRMEESLALVRRALEVSNGF